MTTLEERAPAGFFMTPTERETLSDLLAKAERISADLADAYREAQRIVTGTTDLDPHVDLGDPLAMYRLPSGAVGYVTTYADHIVAGDWVQACHGDPDWHHVAEADAYPEADDGREWVRLVIDGRAVFWLATNAIRRATPPADVVTAQARKAGE